jgi:hypothetical protein
VAFVAVWGFFAWRVIVLIIEPHARDGIEKAKIRLTKRVSLTVQDLSQIDNRPESGVEHSLGRSNSEFVGHGPQEPFRNRNADIPPVTFYVWVTSTLGSS